MPVPAYLLPYAAEPRTKRCHTSFDLRCTCGHELFFAFRRTETKEEKRLVKPYYDYLHLVFSGPRKVTRDEDGTAHHWHTEDGEWVEDNYPEKPFFAFIDALCVTCAACEKRITLFDSRFHGYDAIYCGDLTPEAEAYEPAFRPIGNRDGSPMRIALKLEHDESLEEFRENIGAEATYEAYADAFTWIWVYAIDQKEKDFRIRDRMSLRRHEIIRNCHLTNPLSCGTILFDFISIEYCKRGI